MALYFPLYYWRKRSDARLGVPVAVGAPEMAEEEA
jgi:hypothetical protein